MDDRQESEQARLVRALRAASGTVSCAELTREVYGVELPKVGRGRAPLLTRLRRSIDLLRATGTDVVAVRGPGYAIPRPEATIAVGEYAVEIDTRRVLLHGRAHQTLTPSELAVLIALAQASGGTVHASALVPGISPGSVNSRVNRLNKKLGDGAIVHVHGKGYRLATREEVIWIPRPGAQRLVACDLLRRGLHSARWVFLTYPGLLDAALEDAQSGLRQPAGRDLHVHSAVDGPREFHVVTCALENGTLEVVGFGTGRDFALEQARKVRERRPRDPSEALIRPRLGQLTDLQARVNAIADVVLLRPHRADAGLRARGLHRIGRRVVLPELGRHVFYQRVRDSAGDEVSIVAGPGPDVSSLVLLALVSGTPDVDGPDLDEARELLYWQHHMLPQELEL